MMIKQAGAIAAVALVLGMPCAQAQDATVPAGTPDAMESMPGMTHDTGGMSQGGMDTGSMSMQGGRAPANARDPHAYSGGYDFGPIPPPRMGDRENFGALLIDRLESVSTRDTSSAAYDLYGWFGGMYDRAVLKSEGDADDGRVSDARTELMWGHAVATYWDTQLGVRYDSGVDPGRGWLAFGIQGLAPYWFDVEATAYLGDAGRSAARVAVTYDLLLTQKLILQPRFEANLYGKPDAERELGAGLSNLAAGVRLRYEIRRGFAPYVGVEWEGKYGGTADFARAAGSDPEQTRYVAGLRFWY